jgi:hypothetical protein
MSEPEAYTIVNYVVEFSVRGGPWGTWLGSKDLGDDETEGQEAFLRAWRGKHDPRQMRFRLVKRTAVITDELLAEEHESHAIGVHQGDWTETL